MVERPRALLRFRSETLVRTLAVEHGGSTGRMIVGFTQKEELDEHTKEASEGRIFLILNPN